MANFLPASELPVDRLARVFRNTTNSYKFYWFYAILDFVKSQDTSEHVEIGELLIRMVALAWYPVNFFRISFGKQDQLGQIVQVLMDHTGLDRNSDRREVAAYARNAFKRDSKVKAKILELERYVPTLFLTPFFKESLHGEKGGARKRKIMNLSDHAFSGLSGAAPYRFTENRKIEFHREWLVYMEQNLPFLEGFCVWKLVEYMERRNPNVPNIQQKLFPPQSRDLSRPRKLIKPMVLEGNVRCIYSGASLEVENLSVDHFVPWSFVVHNQLWNLVPTQKEVNSAKSDSLPSLSTYSKDFAGWHFQLFHRYKDVSAAHKVLEDYSIAFHESLFEISNWPKEEFRKRLEEQVAPMLQVAENMGFPAHWTY